jgi:hypothetical protein
MWYIINGKRSNNAKEVKVMKYVDGFTVWNANGNEVSHKAMVEHCKLDLDNISNKSYPYKVKSEVSGYTMKVTPETTPSDWREFSYQCDMALD